MKNFYEVGKVYVWQNMTGIVAYLNGTETIPGDGMHRCTDQDGRIVFAQITDTPGPTQEGGYVGAMLGTLRPKNPPPGEQSVLDQFKLPHLEPA